MTPLQLDILAAIDAGTTGAAVLARKFGGSRQNMLQRLNAMIASGLLVRAGAGWGLTTKGTYAISLDAAKNAPIVNASLRRAGMLLPDGTLHPDAVEQFNARNHDLDKGATA